MRCLLLFAFVLVTGCAAEQRAVFTLPAKPAAAIPEATPEATPEFLAHPDQRVADVRLGTPSGLGTSTRRVDVQRQDAAESTLPSEPRLAWDQH